MTSDSASHNSYQDLTAGLRLVGSWIVLVDMLLLCHQSPKSGGGGYPSKSFPGHNRYTLVVSSGTKVSSPSDIKICTSALTALVSASLQASQAQKIFFPTDISPRKLSRFASSGGGGGGYIPHICIFSPQARYFSPHKKWVNCNKTYKFVLLHCTRFMSKCTTFTKIYNFPT